MLGFVFVPKTFIAREFPWHAVHTTAQTTNNLEAQPVFFIAKFVCVPKDAHRAYMVQVKAPPPATCFVACSPHVRVLIFRQMLHRQIRFISTTSAAELSIMLLVPNTKKVAPDQNWSLRQTRMGQAHARDLNPDNAPCGSCRSNCWCARHR